MIIFTTEIEELFIGMRKDTHVQTGHNLFNFKSLTPLWSLCS